MKPICYVSALPNYGATRRACVPTSYFQYPLCRTTAAASIDLLPYRSLCQFITVIGNALEFSHFLPCVPQPDRLLVHEYMYQPDAAKFLCCCSWSGKLTSNYYCSFPINLYVNPCQALAGSKLVSKCLTTRPITTLGREHLYEILILGLHPSAHQKYCCL